MVSAGVSQTVAAGSTVAFQGTASDPGGASDIAATAWDFNYNGVSFNPMLTGTLTPTDSFTTPGTYLVALQATDQGGNVSTDVTSVLVKPADALLVNAGADQSVTTGTPTSFSGSYSYPAGTVNASGIAWDFNYNGSSFNPMSTGTLTPSTTFGMAGSYQVALRITAVDGSQDLSVLQVTAAAPSYVGPTASAGSDQTINQGGMASFAGSYSDPDGTVSSAGIAWDFNYNGVSFNPTVTGTLTPSQQFLSAGTQQVALQITDSHGLSSLSVLNVTVNGVAPTVSLMSGPSTANAGDTVTFDAMVSNPNGPNDAVALAWDFNYDGTTFNPGQASGTMVSQTFLTPGVFTVAVQATDAAGLSSMATTTVTVAAASVPLINLGGDQALNLGDTGSFAAAISDSGGTVDPTRVDWDFAYNGSFVADPTAHGTLTPSHPFDQPGVFLVALQATDSNGVTRLGTASVSVADVAPDVNPGSDLTVAEGTPVTFQGTATSAGGAADLKPVQWDFAYDGVTFQADPSAAGTLTPTSPFTAPGTYTVALQATDLWGAAAFRP